MKKGLLSSKRRFSPSVELLEDRTLLSGTVTALLTDATGALTITGDIGNNAIHLSVYNNAGVNYLRVSGDLVIPAVPPFVPDFTSVNGASFTDFVHSSVTNITINMNVGIAGANAGADRIAIGTAGSFPVPGIAISGFQIPGNLTINLGTGQGVGPVPGPGTQSVSILGTAVPLLPPITASLNTANIVRVTGGNAAAGNGNELITLTNVTAGAALITTGTGNDTVAMTGAMIGTVTINTGAAGNETVSLTASPGDFTPPTPRPGFGVLSITAAGGNNTITVGGGVIPTTGGNVTIVTGNGNDTVNVGSLAGPVLGTVVKVLSINAGNGQNRIFVLNSSMTSASITNGTGVSPILPTSSTVTDPNIRVASNTITGLAGLVLKSNLPLLGTVAVNSVAITGNTFTGSGNVSVDVGDGPAYFRDQNTDNSAARVNVNTDGTGALLTYSNFTMTGDIGIGTATINLGRNFKFVTIGSDLGAGVVSTTNLTANVNTGADIVVVNANAILAKNITVLDMVNLATGGVNGTNAVGVPLTRAGIFLPTPPTVTVNGNVFGIPANPTFGVLNVTVGNGAKTVTVTDAVFGTETIKIGNGILIAGNLPSLVTISGSVVVDQNITIGNGWGAAGVALSGVNITSAVGQDQTVSVGTGTGQITILGGTRHEVYTFGDSGDPAIQRVVTLGGVISGNQTVNLGQNITLNDTVTVPGAMLIQSTIAGDAAGAQVTVGTFGAPLLPIGSLTITLGNLISSVSVFSVSTSSMSITTGTGIDGVGGTFIVLMGNIISGDLLVNCGGTGGNHTVYLVGLSVGNDMEILLGTPGPGGVNQVFAMAVECLFGMIQGGSGASDTYFDLGGNLGFFVTDFEGMY